jgi:putative copper resistance protein D/copper transport protein
MAALVKSLLFLSVFVLIGSGLVPRFIFRTLWPARFSAALRWAALLGAVLLLLATAADLALTVYGVLGFLDAALLQQYISSTGHGRWSVVRVGAVLLLIAAALLPALAPQAADHAVPVTRKGARAGAPGLAGNILFLLGALTLLFTFSRISHNSTMPGWLPLPADLIHLLAGVGWGSVLLLLAFLPVWNELSRPELERAIARLSQLGLSSVALLFISRIDSGFLHISTPGGLTGTVYGQSLILKVLLVLVIVGLAGLNKLFFLPAFQHYGPARPLHRAMQAEALLLLAVLYVTGVLTTSPMPH